MKSRIMALKQLNQQVGSLKKQDIGLMPNQGWVRTIRKALGMTTQQLAKRLHVNPSRIIKIEMSEIKGGVTLRTMQSVAEALQCRFVYHFVPFSNLEDVVHHQARKKVMAQLKRVSHSMDLEAQSVNQKWLNDQIENETHELLNRSWKHLWEE